GPPAPPAPGGARRLRTRAGRAAPRGPCLRRHRTTRWPSLTVRTSSGKDHDGTERTADAAHRPGTAGVATVAWCPAALLGLAGGRSARRGPGRPQRGDRAGAVAAVVHGVAARRPPSDRLL